MQDRGPVRAGWLPRVCPFLVLLWARKEEPENGFVPRLPWRSSTWARAAAARWPESNTALGTFLRGTRKRGPTEGRGAAGRGGAVALCAPVRGRAAERAAQHIALIRSPGKLKFHAVPARGHPGHWKSRCLLRWSDAKKRAGMAGPFGGGFGGQSLSVWAVRRWRARYSVCSSTKLPVMADMPKVWKSTQTEVSKLRMTKAFVAAVTMK